MARKPTARAEFVFFDVLYDDGSQSSNRKVPADMTRGPDADEAVLAHLLEQDREIAERSRRPRPAIKSISRSDGR